MHFLTRLLIFKLFLNNLLNNNTHYSIHDLLRWQNITIKKVSNKKKKIKVLKAIEKDPFKSSREIGRETGISGKTVSKIRKETTLVITRESIKLGVLDFIKRFTDAEKYFEKKEKELELLKKETKTIFKVGKNGNKYPEEVPLDPMDKLLIIKEQRQNQLDLLFMVSKPKVILGLQQVENAPHLE